MRSVRGVIVVFVGAVAGASSVGAQPAPDPAPASDDSDRVRRAEQAMRRGSEASARGDHGAALEAYLEAAELVLDANLPHKLAGESLEALGRYDDAIAEYRKYIAIKPDAKGVPEVAARIEKIERERFATLVVQCAPGAIVDIDGKVVGTTPLAPVRRAAPAALTLTIDATGYERWADRVELAPGTRTAVKCSLVAKTMTPPSIDDPIDTRPWYRSPYVLVPAAVAVVGVGVALAFVLSDRPPATDGGHHGFP